MSQNLVNLEEQIKMLVELQGLDTQVLKVKRDLESIPEELKAMDEGFKEKTKSLKQLEDELKTIQLKRKEKELDLDTKEAVIKKQQGQLYQVKTNKEYAALEQEMARIRADNSLIEEDIIKLLDQTDLQNQKIAKGKEALKAEEARFAEEKKVKGDQAKVLEAEFEKLDGQRSILAGKVDKKILSRYERILDNKDGLAVVPVVNDSCQGCYRVMPPQVINEVRMKAEIVLCENCSRILYIET